MIPVMHFNKAPVLKIDNNVWKICHRVIVIAPHLFANFVDILCYTRPDSILKSKSDTNN
jgi:hypothetical protein